MKEFYALFRRDLTLAWRQGGGALTGALFLLGLTLLLPLSLGPDLNFLARLAPALIWIGVLLASFFSLDRLFQADDEDGTLDIFFMGTAPMELLVLAKIAAHWLSHAAPLILLSPLFAIMLGVDPQNIGAMILSLIAGTPAITAIGALAAALTLRLRRGGLLLPVLALPLSMPVLLFGALSAAPLAATGLAEQPLDKLALFTVLALALTPFATAAALKASRS